MREAWRYWRPNLAGVVELGTVRGRDVALPTHFHGEDQITIVHAGTRRFVIGGTLVEVAAGHGIRIPAGTPHRSLAGAVDVACLNLYLPPATDAEIELLQSRYGVTIAAAPVGASRPPPLAEQDAGAAPWEAAHWGTVAQAAEQAGMSREGYTRRFKRVHGLAPQEFRLLRRLNDARVLLRQGHPIASAAVEAGFADQSHLGRCFRRFFGVTPGRYQAG